MLGTAAYLYAYIHDHVNVEKGIKIKGCNAHIIGKIIDDIRDCFKKAGFVCRLDEVLF